MKNKKNQNKNARMTTITIIFGVILIVIAVSLNFFQKNRQDTNLKQRQNIKKISEGTDISKASSYQQEAFIHIYNTGKGINALSEGPYQLSELELGEEYSSCSGTLDFQGELFKRWNFQTNCKDDQNNSNPLLISYAKENSEIGFFKKVDGGYAVLTRSLKEADIGIVYLDNDYNVVWEKHIKDSTTEEGYILTTDLMATKDGIYALGYTVKVTGGDFSEYLESGSNFSFLLKYDYAGNLIKFINLDTLSNQKISRVYTLERIEGNKLYMTTEDQVLMLTNDETLDILDFSKNDISIEEINGDNYLVTKTEERKIEDQTKIVDQAQVLNKDGNIRWTIDASKLVSSQEDESYIEQFISVSNFYIITIRNKAYIIDKNGKIIKTLDYTNLLMNNQEMEAQGKITVIAKEKSYVVIMYPDYNSVHLEEYNFNHKIIDEKTYTLTRFLWFDGKSDDTTWTYQDKKLTMEFNLAAPIPTWGKITLE